MGTAGPTELDRLDARDREYVERLDEGERDVVVSTILRYGRQEALRVGDRRSRRGPSASTSSTAAGTSPSSAGPGAWELDPHGAAAALEGLPEGG